MERTGKKWKNCFRLRWMGKKKGKEELRQKRMEESRIDDSQDLLLTFRKKKGKEKTGENRQNGTG